MKEYGIADRLASKPLAINEISSLDFPSLDGPEENIVLRSKQPFCPKTVGNACHQVAEHVSMALDSHEFPLTLGGDHSLGIGTLAGSLAHLSKHNTKLGVIWVDAHLDINTCETSSSGNIHGMPLSFVTGFQRPAGIPGFEWMDSFTKGALLDLKDLVYIGIRDPEPYELYITKQNGSKVFTAMDVERFGMPKVVEMALDHLRQRNMGRLPPLHLSLDVDSLDPLYAPSTGTKVGGGLTLREGLYLATEIANTGSLIAADVTEFNPLIGSQCDQRKTAQAVVDLALALTPPASGTGFGTGFGALS